jgi:sulfite reductase (NADPH) hemoprotein beta-component
MSARKEAPTLQVLTANRLSDGAVVYLTAAGTWASEVSRSVVAREEKAAAALLARGQRDADAAIVVGPYLIAVVEGDAGPRPASLRERIRAEGPSGPVAEAVADAVARAYP